MTVDDSLFELNWWSNYVTVCRRNWTEL